MAIVLAGLVVGGWVALFVVIARAHSRYVHGSGWGVHSGMDCYNVVAQPTAEQMSHRWDDLHAGKGVVNG